MKDLLKNKTVMRALSKVRKVTKSVGDVANALSRIENSPNKYSYLSLGLLGMNMLADGTRPTPALDSQYKRLFIPLHLQMLALLKEHPSAVVTSDALKEHTTVALNTGTVVAAYSSESYTNSIITFYTQTDDIAAVRAELRGMVWKSIGTRARLSQRKGKDRYSGYLGIDSWAPDKIYHSKQSAKFAKRCTQFQEKGLGRVILFNGIPGTGKSCMLDAIATSLKGLVLHLPRDTMASMDAHGMAHTLQFLSPDVAIIDDVDRANVSDPLAAIELIKESVDVVLLTSNHEDDLGAAFKRPGRIDEIYQIDKMVQVRDIMQEVPDHLEEELEKWPVAFVSELNARYQVFGDAVFDTELDGLRARVAENKENKKAEVKPK